MIWTWIVGRIIQPFLPFVLGGFLALSVAGTLGGVWYGYSWASASCSAAAALAESKAKDLTIERYKALLKATELQRATEAAKALDNASALQDRAAELESDKAKAEAAQQDVEADLTAAIQDKGTLNAIVQKIRAAPHTDCRASDADVRLDRRLRGVR